MKRIGGLFAQIADARTVVHATWRAAQGKRERPGVRRFLSNLDREVSEIVDQLQNGSYRFGNYAVFPIRDPKTRLIHAPAFRDRVVHHAMVAVAGPVLERGATVRSYACRRGRGQHAALAQARKWARRTDWFLKLDVARFYDSIPHATLREALRRRFRERRLLGLFERLLESHQAGPGLGLPIGALTSQYLGNYYLDCFDHWVLGRAGVPRYLRYMDDLLLISDRERLRDVFPSARAVLEGLGLRVKEPGILNRCAEGVPFLGFVVYPDRLRLDRRGRRRLRRKWGGVEREFLAGCISERALQDRVAALFAHAAHGDDVGWRRAVTGFSRIGEVQGTGAARFARRVVEQHREELPLRLPQQEQGGRTQQELWFPGLSVPWHGGAVPPPDVAPSRACASEAQDETARKSPPAAEIHPSGEEKAAGGAAGSKGGDE